MTIGQRAAHAVKVRAWKEETSFFAQCRKIDVFDAQLRAWAAGKANPCAVTLANMYEAGYDIVWILTGKEQNADG